MTLSRLWSLGLLLGLILSGSDKVNGQGGGSVPSKALSLKRSGVSASNLLGIERKGPGRLPKGSMEGESDTVRVLALRVQFQKDDEPQTTGDGTFDLSTSSEAEIDPPPHNYGYFERHLRALRNYYHSASQGKLVILSTLYTCGGDSDYVFNLPHRMAFYTSGPSSEANDSLLAVFFRDVIRMVDTTCSIQFSAYDSYLIFHAGAGRESDLRRNSPKDIPSAFYSFDDLKKYLGGGDPTYEGIRVKEGFVREGFWLPETESQDGYELGLNGIAAHLFGYQLGLPSLFKTDPHRSGIGLWGLMDHGFENDSSRVPAQPCAWSKAFLGWVEPYEVKGSVHTLIAAWALNSDSIEVVKVSITPTEYFLIENRQQDVNGDGTVVKTIEEGVVIDVDEYDWFIPGSGLLIWHIDEEVIAANYWENKVNANPGHRGVDLEEADGVQEIGTSYGYIYGQKEDAYYAGNESWELANPLLDEVSFTPTSVPNSRSYSGANSHIHVTDIGVSKPVMTFKVSLDTYQPGWPQILGSSIGTNSPVFGDLDNDGDIEVVLTSEDGRVFVWNEDGSKFIQNSDSVFVLDPKGDTLWVRAAIFAETGDSIFSSPASGDIDGDGDLEVVIGSDGERVYAWHHTDNNPSDGRGDLVEGFPVELESKIRSSVVIADMDAEAPGLEIVVGTMDGRLFLVYSDGDKRLLKTFENDAIKATTAVADIDGDGALEIVVVTEKGSMQAIRFDRSDLGWTITVDSPIVSSPVIGDIDRDNTNEIVVVSGAGKIYAFRSDRNPIYNWPVEVGDHFESSPALGDIDGDGYLEIVVSGTNKIYAFNYNGSALPNWPVTVDRTDPVGVVISSSPVIGDIDGDKDLEVVVGSPKGQLLAYHHDGTVVDGFPLPCGGEVNSTPALLDVDGGGDVEVMVGSDDGYLYMWDLPGTYNDENIPWPMYAHDVQHTGAFPMDQLPPEIPEEELLSETSVYNFPNPTEGNSTLIRYRLGEEASVTIKIFNLAGELVDKFTGPGYAHTENEVRWDLTDFATGVYICRVEATGAIKTKTAFCKIAVVK
ncbi:MAG: FG-GAP-like repeat-containing protein [bacterium]